MFSPTQLGGGPFNGYSTRQTITNYKTSEHAMARRVLRDGWNTSQATGSVNGHNRIITPFRAVNNLGDFLSRKQYNDSKTNMTNASRPGYKSNIGTLWRNTDDSGVPSSAGNMRYVSDSSDYIKYKKQSAMNQVYNDLGYGGSNNGSYVAVMSVRH